MTPAKALSFALKVLDVSEATYQQFYVELQQATAAAGDATSGDLVARRRAAQDVEQVALVALHRARQDVIDAARALKASGALP